MLSRLDEVARVQKPKSADVSVGQISIWRRTARLLAAFLPLKSIGPKLEGELAKADWPLRGDEFFVGSLVGAILTGTLSLLLTSQPFLSAILAITMGLLPFIMLRLSKVRRIKTFEGQLCDALNMMANTLRAGFSFLQALDMVKKEMPAPISKEFGRTLQEIRLGAATEDALVNLINRVGSHDLDLVITAVLIQRQVGGNLAEVLDNIAHTIRERIKIKREINILTAQGRISGLIIGLLPVALALVLLVINPGYIQELFHNPTGTYLLTGATFSEILGFLVIHRIMNIKV
ncbi:MAG: type II secretion system F family protein [Peptococcaceae bacterium]|nr:type II secretion system F family protein [Peptococcaceae bacterium]